MSDHTNDPRARAISEAPVAITPGREAEFLEMLCRALDVQVSILDETLRYQLISDSTYKNLSFGKADLNVGDHLSQCHDIMLENGQLTPEIIKKNRLTVEEQLGQSERNLARPTLVTLGDGTTHRHVRKILPNGYVLSLADDVSDLVEKDQMLEEALLLGNSGYWTYDFQTKKYWLSRSLRNFFNEGAIDRIHKDGIVSTIHADDRSHFFDTLRAVMSDKKRHSVTCRTHNFEGHMRWAKTSIELICDDTGRPKKLRAFTKDVTQDRQKAEELEVIRDEAISANLAKTEFLANMSHEIRTPMNGILGMVELLGQADLPARERKLINVINKSASALLTIVNDILDFSKIEAGALDLESRPFNLKELLTDVTALLRHQAQSKSLNLSINYPADAPCHMMGDEGRIRQVVTNLVGNAIKFTGNGFVKLDVKTVINEDVVTVQVAVIDSGIGVSSDKLATIFDKFTQADGSTTRIYGGTGLGLTICKRIVDIMGGDMIAKSIEGKGSAFGFRVDMPLASEDEASKIYPETLKFEDIADEMSTDVSSQTIEILVAEDFALNREVIQLMLEDTGFAPIFAEHGQEAIELFAKDPFRFPVILMDVSMPVMDGYEASRNIRKIEAKLGIAPIPIIALTGHALQKDKQVCLKAGMDDFLSKPVRQTDLLEMIEQHISGDISSSARLSA